MNWDQRKSFPALDYLYSFIPKYVWNLVSWLKTKGKTKSRYVAASSRIERISNEGQPVRHSIALPASVHADTEEPQGRPVQPDCDYVTREVTCPTENQTLLCVCVCSCTHTHLLLLKLLDAKMLQHTKPDFSTEEKAVVGVGVGVFCYPDMCW